MIRFLFLLIIFIICVALLYWLITSIIEWFRHRTAQARNYLTHGYQRWVLLGVIIVIGIIFLSIPSQSNNNCHKNNNYVANNPLPSQSKVKSSKLFTFDKTSKEIKVYLRSGWKDYPKGGGVKIITPNGNILEDKPGIDKNFGYQPEGWYIFCGEKNTTGVEIYNYW
jgi:hypothetical protein